jgi:hypothetical protein
MPHHVRRRIRQAVATRLTNLATTGTRVFISRVYPLAESKLPGILIYTPQESSQVDSITKPRGLARGVNVVVEGVVESTGALDDDLDQIAVEVEQALGADPSLGGLVKDTRLSGTQIMHAGDGKKPVGAIRMTFEVIYRTPENNPTTTI